MEPLTISAGEAAKARRAARFGVPHEPPQSTRMEIDAQAEVARRRRRAERFGVAGDDHGKDDKGGNVKVEGILEERREVGDGEVVRKEAVCCWPMDMLSTGEVVEYFQGWDIAVEWLNDSNCNVVFKDEKCRDEAVGVICGGWGGGGDVEKGEGVGDMEVDGEEGKRWKAWRLGRVGVKGGFRLWVRGATDKDVRPKAPNPNSRWSRSMREKRLHGVTGGGLGIESRLGLPLGSGLSTTNVIKKKRKRRTKKPLEIDATTAELFGLDTTIGDEGGAGNVTMKS